MHHWDSIAAVIQNDVLFSYVRKSFVAIGTVRSLVSVEPKHFANISAEAGAPGMRATVDYELLAPSVGLSSFPKEFLKTLSYKNGPLNKNLKGNQGYIFSLPFTIGRRFTEQSES